MSVIGVPMLLAPVADPGDRSEHHCGQLAVDLPRSPLHGRRLAGPLPGGDDTGDSRAQTPSGAPPGPSAPRCSCRASHARITPPPGSPPSRPNPHNPKRAAATRWLPPRIQTGSERRPEYSGHARPGTRAASCRCLSSLPDAHSETDDLHVTSQAPRPGPVDAKSAGLYAIGQGHRAHGE
jgi:hypothetical protein